MKNPLFSNRPGGPPRPLRWPWLLVLLLTLTGGLLHPLSTRAQYTASTLAGFGTAGFADGPGTTAQFNLPYSVAVDGAGTVYVADYLNNRIRKVTAAGVVTTLAGSGTLGSADGMGTAAQFSRPAGVAVDGAGTVYVADYNNNRIRQVTAAGVVTTLAGCTSGNADGTGSAAQFSLPASVAVDGSGTVYVADYLNNLIRKVTAAGVVTTLAGSTAGNADGTGSAAQFNAPYGVAVDGAGSVYVGDLANHRIRQVTAAGVVTTLAGSTQGFANGTGSAAQFNQPQGVAVDGAGNVYVGETGNQRIRKLAPPPSITVPTVTTAAPTNVGVTSATLGGNVTADGGATVTERGVVYVAGTGTPTTANNKTTIGTGTGSFSQAVTGLTAATLYTTRAYAINSAGTSYGSSQTFTTAAALAASTSRTNVSCFGGSNGTATVMATGGVTPYTYSWDTSPVQTTATATGLAAGTYTVTVTDAASQTTTATATITAPPALASSVSSQTNVACFGGSTGSATVGVSGGTPGYTYSWAPSGGSAATATGLAAGSYTVTITDANSCTKTQGVTITQPASALAVSTSKTDATTTGGTNGTATATPSGGTPAYTYSWNTSPVQTSATATGLSAGTYAVTVTDANSCTTTGSATVGQPAALTLSTNAVSGSPFCAGSAISVSFTASTAPNAGNVYTAQLSSASGSFASPVSLGTLASAAASGTISGTVPAGTAQGSGYRVRVVASSPATTGTDNGSNLTVTNTPAPTGSASQSFSSGATVANLAATGTAIQWYAASTGGSPLASTTALVNGTTYYATQTVSGCESQSRLAVTATVTAATTAPTVSTTAPTSITATSATLGGNVTNNGGSTITERGVVYVAGSGTPTTGSSKITAPGTTGSYTASAAGLAPGTLYTTRAYATNAQGTSYGNNQTFTTDAVTDVTWTGAVSTSWATAGNWSPAVVPTSSINVTIPAAPANQPVVSGTQAARNVTVQTGASLALAATTAPTTQLTLGNVVNGNGITGSLTLASGSTLTQAAGSELYISGDMTNNGASFVLDPTSEVGFGTGISNPHIINGTAGVTFQTLTVGEQGGRDFLGTFVPVQVRRKLGLYNNSVFTADTGISITLLSDATGTALLENGDAGSTVLSPITVQRYIDPSLNASNGYRHYSAPVSNTTLADLTTSGYTPSVSQATTYNASATPGTTTPFPTLFAYDQARVTLTNNYAAFDKGFVVPTALTQAMTPGQGYVAQIGAAQLVDFVGTSTTGDLTRTLTRNAAGTTNDAAAGWQLVGNPYPAPLNYALVAAADRTGLDAGMYVVQSTGPYAGGYRSFVNGVSTGNGNGLIASSQGFWVRVSTGQTTGSLTFRNSQRITDYATQQAFQRTTPDPRPQVRLELAGSGLTDAWVAYAEAGAGSAFDTQYDAAKLANSTGLNLSSEAGNDDLAIDGQAAFTAATVLPLAVGVPAAGAYTLALAELRNLPAGLTAYLRDAQTGSLTALAPGTSYAFSVTNAQALVRGRFAVVFRSSALAASPAALAAQVSVYPNPARAFATLDVPGVAGASQVQVQVLNALGQVVLRQQAALPASGASLTLPTGQLASGVYVVRLALGQTTLTKRLTVE